MKAVWIFILNIKYFGEGFPCAYGKSDRRRNGIPRLSDLQQISGFGFLQRIQQPLVQNQEFDLPQLSYGLAADVHGGFGLDLP